MPTILLRAMNGWMAGSINQSISYSLHMYALLHSFYLRWQCLPLYHSGHVHTYARDDFDSRWHVPPFWQGLLSQGSTSTVRRNKHILKLVLSVSFDHLFIALKESMWNQMLHLAMILTTSIMDKKPLAYKLLQRSLLCTSRVNPLQRKQDTRPQRGSFVIFVFRCLKLSGGLRSLIAYNHA